MAARLASGGRYYGDDGQAGEPGAALRTKQLRETTDDTCQRPPPIGRVEASKSAGREEGRRQEEASWEPKHTKSAMGYFSSSVCTRYQRLVESREELAGLWFLRAMQRRRCRIGRLEMQSGRGGTL